MSDPELGIEGVVSLVALSAVFGFLLTRVPSMWRRRDDVVIGDPATPPSTSTSSPSDCGWLGETRDSYEDAFLDATQHDPTRMPETVRPVA